MEFSPFSIFSIVLLPRFFFDHLKNSKFFSKHREPKSGEFCWLPRLSSNHLKNSEVFDLKQAEFDGGFSTGNLMGSERYKQGFYSSLDFMKKLAEF